VQLTDSEEEVEELLADASGKDKASFRETVHIGVVELEATDNNGRVYDMVSTKDVEDSAV